MATRGGAGDELRRRRCRLRRYLTGWDLGFVRDRIEAVFDFSLFGLGARLLQSAWDGMTSIVEPMVAAISAAIAALVPDWLLHAWDWVSGGGASAAAGDAPGRALGGPVRAGQVYRWMEEGEELFSPRVDGSVISTRELKALRGAPAARPAPSAASSTSTRRRWPTEHDHERRRHRPCPCRAGADPRRFDPPRGALERHREALVQDRLSALPPCDAPPSERRRPHRPGAQAKLDADPELQAFVLARLDRLTFK
ncbi:MAG: hypothetical protein U1E59_00410, partial [Amaricoccus sp.]